MDIASLSTNMAMFNLQSQVGVAMLSKSLDMSEATGAQFTKMLDAAAMERSVNPAIGSHFDMSV